MPQRSRVMIIRALYAPRPRCAVIRFYIYVVVAPFSGASRRRDAESAPLRLRELAAETERLRTMVQRNICSRRLFLPRVDECAQVYGTAQELRWRALWSPPRAQETYARRERRALREAIRSRCHAVCHDTPYQPRGRVCDDEPAFKDVCRLPLRVCAKIAAAAPVVSGDAPFVVA